MTRIPAATTNISSRPTWWSAPARRPTSAGWQSSDKWTETEPTENQRVWTDDYSNILGAVYRRLRYGE